MRNPGRTQFRAKASNSPFGEGKKIGEGVAGLPRKAPLKRSNQNSMLERKKQEVDLRRDLVLEDTRTILEALPQGVVGLDLQGTILFANSSAEKLLDCDQASLIGKELHRLAHPEACRALPCSEDICPLLSLVATGKFGRVESDTFQTALNESIYVSYNSSPIKRGEETIGWIVAFEDISGKSETSNAITHYAHQIEAQNVMLQAYCEKVALAQHKLQSQTDELTILNHEMKLMNDRLQSLATTDGMTGLANHQEFQSRLRNSWNGDRRQYNVKLLSLLMVDVDYFKEYNDAFGHPSGDEALKIVAEVLKENIRSSDLLARYGGEEFVIIAWDTDSADAIALANRLCQVIEARDFPNRRVTISVGVATHDIRAQTPSLSQAWYVSPDALIRAADDALYEAKRQGRNRTFFIGDFANETPKAIATNEDIKEIA